MIALISIMRVLAYVRFSSDMQDPRSANDQDRECGEWTGRNGYTYLGSERDEAIRAGAVAGRVAWARVLERARRKEFDLLLVWDIVRFSRDFFGGLAVLGELHALGIKFADTKRGIIDLDSPEGRMYLAMNLAMGEQETRNLGDRCKRGLRGQVLNGYSSGGQAPYGFSRRPEFSETALDLHGRPKLLGVRLDIHPVDSLIVVRIFEMFADGWTKHAIARHLNEQGVLTKRAGGTRLGIPNSGTWSASSVKKILENEVYRGVRIWNQQSRKGARLPRTGKKGLVKNDSTAWDRVENFAPAIIGPGLWERVQVRLRAVAAKYAEKTKASKSGLRHVANADRQYLLSGLVRCAGCGASFVIGLKRKGVSCYRCSFRSARGAVVCLNTVTVPQPALEERVKLVLNAVVKDPKQLASLVKEHNQRLSQSNEGQLAVVRSLQAQQDAAKSERDRLVQAIAHGTGSASVLVAEIEKREKLLSDLAERIRDAEALVQPLLLPRPAAVADYLAGNASIFDGDKARDRTLLERTLDAILVYASGEIMIRFRRDSLFAPVAGYWMTGTDGTPAPSSSHRDQFTALKKRVGADARFWASDGPDGPAYAATTSRLLAAGEDGCDAFVVPMSGEKAIATPAGQRRDLADVDSEKTVATPTGFLRDLASEAGKKTVATPTGFEPVSPA